MDNDNLGLDSTADANERMVPQSTVGAAIRREKEETAERVRKQMEAEFQEKLKSIQPVDKEALYAEWEQRSMARNAEQKAKEENERTQREYETILKRVDSKLVAAKDDYEDFDEVVRAFPWKEYPSLVIGADNFPNTAEVMKYLADHPVKADELDRTSLKNWNGFVKEMKKISDALLENKSAAQSETKAKAPLSRNKSSVVGLNNDDGSWDSIKSDKSLRF
jgi:hypothetical protein